MEKIIYPKWYRENGIKYTRAEFILVCVLGIGAIISCLGALIYYVIDKSDLYRFILVTMISLAMITLVDRIALRRKIEELNNENKSKNRLTGQ